MRRLRVQLTVLVALLGMLVLAWGAAIFLGAREAARSGATIQSTVDRVDELPRAATGLAELLVLRDMPVERQRSSAVEILDASRRLARLIHDLLSVSRMESGRLVLDPRPCRWSGATRSRWSRF